MAVQALELITERQVVTEAGRKLPILLYPVTDVKRKARVL